jgi:ribonuclease-3
MDLEKDFSQLEKKLKVTFSDQKLLVNSCVHRSYLNEHPGFELGHNERLEFLGDAVLELVVTEYLFNKFDNPEGELTNWRASLVNGNFLADIAKRLGIEEFLLLSKGESKDTDSKARHYILADVMEAVIGAIYLDQGMDVSRMFIEENILVELPRILENQLYLDAKTRFQEASQDKVGITPTYKVLEESGPDHAKIFRVGIYLNEELVAEAEGSSKQEAQLNAAANACEVKNW